MASAIKILLIAVLLSFHYLQGFAFEFMADGRAEIPLEGAPGTGTSGHWYGRLRKRVGDSRGDSTGDSIVDSNGLRPLLTGRKRQSNRDQPSVSEGSTQASHNQQGGGHIDLIPGILDDITLAHITTKLSVRDLFRMLAVNQVWGQAIRSRQVYDHRIRAHATEEFTVVPIITIDPDTVPLFEDSPITLSVHSENHKYCWDLPWEHTPIVALQDRTRLPLGSKKMYLKHLCLDGRIYLLTVSQAVSGDLQYFLAVAFVFDVITGNNWTEFASRQLIPREFGPRSACCSLEGKFYIAAPTCPGTARWDYLIFDPKANSWWSATRTLLQPKSRYCICSLDFSKLKL